MFEDASDFDPGHSPLVEADAQEMIDRYGDGALHAARLRSHAQAEGVEFNRPPDHWESVQNAISRRLQQLGDGC